MKNKQPLAATSGRVVKLVATSSRVRKRSGLAVRTNKTLSKKISAFIILFLLIASSAFALTLSYNHHSPYKIILPQEPSETELHAAFVLSDYLREIGGCLETDYTVLRDTRDLSKMQSETFDGKKIPAKGILLGNNAYLKKLNINIDFKSLTEDGYTIQTKDDYLIICGGSDKGIIYGVYAFLEKFCGCRKYSADFKIIPRQDIFKIPDSINYTSIPKIKFREYHYWATIDDEYMEWHALNHHMASTGRKENPFAVDTNLFWGMYVHTFDKLVPAVTYYDSHPEYYSFYGGKRQPAQLCLSNDTVYQVLINALKEAMIKKPLAKYWSVSQNDNYGFCQCERCKRIDAIEGSPSGSLIRFVNRVAANFPDKIISTLAYEFSRSAPLITKPANNVNIMFCSIECNRSKPIATDPASASFRKDFEDWSKLTSNILVWDYVVQFSNFISPFPNLKVLQPNLQYFASHGVTDMFEQGSANNWSDMGELKAYMISNLLWNPDVNIDSVKQDFLKGYYGAAAPNINDYLNALEHNLDTTNATLDIFGNAVTPHDTWLSGLYLLEYGQIIRLAGLKLKHDSISNFHFEKIPLVLAHTYLEQSKFYGTGAQGIFEKDDSGKWKPQKKIVKALEVFTEMCKKHDIKSLDENNFSPDDYYNQYQHIFEHGMIDHLAFEKNVSFEIPFSPKYPAKGANTLTDGVGGYDDYHYNWLGWEGEDMIATVDLGETKNMKNISCDFMEDQKSWIFHPSNVEFYFSEDGKKFNLLGSMKSEVPVFNKNFNAKTYSTQSEKLIKARYIKVVANNLKTCPKWHIGAGYPSWIFCDEIVVK